MDINEINKALEEIVGKREELQKLDYSNPKYDDLEEALHDLEDDFQDNYGDFMEEILQDVHDEFCPDNDVLLPIAYLGQGVIIDVDKLPGKDTRLVLVPNPVRILLTVGKDKQQVVWQAK